MTKLRILKLRKGFATPRFLLELENKISKELIQFEPEFIDKKIHSQKLLLRPGHKQMPLSIIRRLRLIWRIKETRGQLRWLCYSLFTPVMGNAYQLSRAKLVGIIGRNWQRFSEEVLSCLGISNEDTNDFECIAVYQYWNPRTTRPLNIGQTYVLECKPNMKSIHGITRSLSNFTLARIIQWDSSFAINLIQRSSSLKASAQLGKFLKNFPDFQDLLNSRTSLEVVFHPKCNEIFDQRIRDRNSGIHDVATDVEIWHQRFIIKGECWLLIDSTCSPRLEFVAGQWQFLERNKVEHSKVDMQVPREPNRVNLDEAIFLMGRVDENWYHLLLDTLPRYLLLKGINPEVPVLIRGDLPKTSKILLERLIEREIIYVQPDDLVIVKSLYFIPARSTVYDSTPEKSEKRVSYSPVIIQKQREWILKSFPLDQSQAYPERIFLTRRASYRNLLNIDAISSFFKKNDFHVIEPDESFYMNQAGFFSKAKTIVSPGGAVLANIIFMQRGSRVISIRSWRGSDVPLWNSLADACEVSHSEVIGFPTYFGFRSLMRTHANYFVPLKRMKKVLSS